VSLVKLELEEQAPKALQTLYAVLAVASLEADHDRETLVVVCPVIARESGA